MIHEKVKHRLIVIVLSCIISFIPVELLSADQDFVKRLEHSKDSEKAEILNQWAYSIRLKNYKLSLEKATKALQWSEKLQNQKQKGWALALIGLSQVFQGQYAISEVNLKKALEICQNTLCKDKEIKILNWLGNLNYSKGDFQNALDYYKIVIKQAEKTNNKSFKANALSNIGVILSRQGFFTNSMNYYLNALDLYEELGLTRRIPATLINIGVIYSRLQNYDKALDYYQIALEKANENNNQQFTALAQSNIGVVLSKQGKYSRAKQYFLEALDIRKKAGATSKVIHILINLAYIERKNTNFDKCQLYIDEAQKLIETNKSTYLNGTLLVHQGELFLCRKEYSKAIQTARKALKSFTKTSNKNQEVCTYLLLSQIYSEIKDNSKALHYYRKYQEHASKYMGNKTINKVLELDFKKRQENLHQYVTQIQQKKNIILWGGIITSMLLIFGLIITWIGRNSLKRRSRYLLQLKEEEINKVQTRMHWMIGELKTYLALKNRKKYEKSTLSKKDSMKIVQALQTRMEQQQEFINPDLTLNSLAEMIDCSPKALSQVINEQFAKNFNDYINCYRLEMAKKLLKESTDLSILDVAYDVGFYSKTSFNTSFKKLTGMTPSQFRQQHTQ